MSESVEELWQARLAEARMRVGRGLEPETLAERYPGADDRETIKQLTNRAVGEVINGDYSTITLDDVDAAARKLGIDVVTTDGGHKGVRRRAQACLDEVREAIADRREDGNSYVKASHLADEVDAAPVQIGTALTILEDKGELETWTNSSRRHVYRILEDDGDGDREVRADGGVRADVSPNAKGQRIVGDVREAVKEHWSRGNSYVSAARLVDRCDHNRDMVGSALGILAAEGYLEQWSESGTTAPTYRIVGESGESGESGEPDVDPLRYLTNDQLRRDIAYAVGGDWQRYEDGGRSRHLNTDTAIRVGNRIRPDDAAIVLEECTLTEIYATIRGWCGLVDAPANSSNGLRREELQYIYRQVDACDPREVVDDV